MINCFISLIASFLPMWDYCLLFVFCLAVLPCLLTIIRKVVEINV